MYIKARAKNQESRTVLSSLVDSARKLGYSFADGVLGIALEPWQGYHREGFEGSSQTIKRLTQPGFLKGIPRGAIGLAFLPALGIVDFVTTATTGAKNVIVLFATHQKRLRIRPPRCFLVDSSIQPYSLKHAIGQHYLTLIDKGNESSS